MDTIIRGEIKYYVVSGFHEVFQYTEGDFGKSDSLYKLSGFHDLSEAIRAQNYSLGRYGCGEIVKAYPALVKVESINAVTIESEIKALALSKLTDTEKRVLGLEDS